MYSSVTFTQTRTHARNTSTHRMICVLFTKRTVYYKSNVLIRQHPNGILCYRFAFVLPFLSLIHTHTRLASSFRFYFHRRFGQIRFKWPGKVFHNHITHRRTFTRTHSHFSKDAVHIYFSITYRIEMQCVGVHVYVLDPVHVKKKSVVRPIQLQAKRSKEVCQTNCRKIKIKRKNIITISRCQLPLNLAHFFFYPVVFVCRLSNCRYKRTFLPHILL